MYIKYKDPIAAFYCQQFLDGEYIASLKAHLIVKWIEHPPEGCKRAQKAIRKQEEEKEESDDINSEQRQLQAQKSPIFSVQADLNQISAPISTKEEQDSTEALIKITESLKKEVSESTKGPIAESESQQFDIASNLKFEINQNWSDIDTPHHTMFYKETIQDLLQPADESLPATDPKPDVFPHLANRTDFGFTKPQYLGMPPVGKWLQSCSRLKYRLGKPDTQVNDESTIK